MMYQKAIDPNEFLKQMKAKQEQEEVYISGRKDLFQNKKNR